MNTPIPITSINLPLVLFDSPVMAAFPSPAADYAQKRIDLNDHLLLHREASFLFRVRGNSMIGVGIFDGDTIIVDRSIDAKHTGAQSRGIQRKPGNDAAFRSGFRGRERSEISTYLRYVDMDRKTRRINFYRGEAEL